MPAKPSEAEEEYFARLEFEKLKTAEIVRREQFETEEMQRLKELHHMCCPKCGMQLIEIDFHGVAVDKCSGCDGVWLDAGELEQVASLDEGKLAKWFGVFKR